MGIGKLIEEVGGAIAAEQAAEALDPNAGILVKGAAAVAGFMGASTLSNALEAHTEAQRHPAPAAALDASDSAPEADTATDTDTETKYPSLRPLRSRTCVRARRSDPSGFSFLTALQAKCWNDAADRRPERPGRYSPPTLNVVASATAMPTIVRTEMRNGQSTLVAPTGASQISMSLFSAMNLVAGRSRRCPEIGV